MAAPEGLDTAGARRVRRPRRVRRLGPSGLTVRPPAQPEQIDYPGGTYTVRRPPRVELTLVDPASVSSFTGSVLVLNTHQRGLAEELAWPVWSAQRDGQLPAPTIGWWRQVPTDDADPGIAGQGHDSLWWPVPPGTPGAVPGVEFAFPARERGGRR